MSLSPRFTLTANSIGTIAADILRVADRIEIIAVFERAFYIMCDSGIVAVAVANLGDGPINILVPAAPDGSVLWPQPLPTGLEGRVEAQSIRLGDDIAISLARAPVWTPPPWPRWPAPAAGAGVAALAARGATAAPIDGLAPLVFAPHRKRTRTGEAAEALVRDLTRQVQTATTTGLWTPEALATATLLVGLGPGLTPSGDDFLGGLMLALTAMGQTGLRDALWDAIVDELGDLTVPVSAMHLSAAADGMAHTTFHAAARAVLTNDTAALDPAITAAAALGATSGWDALAGFAIGLNAALR